MQGLFISCIYKRKAIFIFSLAAYALLFVLIARQAGHGAILALLPVLTAALCWGWRAGLAAGFCAFPLNMLMMTVFGLDWKPGMLSSTGIIGHIAFVLEGVFVGWIRDLYLERQRFNELLQQEMARRSRDIEMLRTAEKQLESVLEQSADGIFITQSGTETILAANRAFLEMVGMRRDEVIGNKPYCFMPEVDTTYRTTLGDEVMIDLGYYDTMYQNMSRLLNEVMISWEYYVVNHEGELVPVEASVSNMLDEQDRCTAQISIVRDITHRKLIERELSSTNDFLNNIIENSLDGIIISDATGHVASINRACATIMGYDADELIGLNPSAFAFFDEGWYETTQGEQVWVGMSDLMAAYSRMDEFFKEGKISNYNFYIKRRDGRLAEVETNIVMLYSQKGDAVGSVSIMRDITARKRMEHELVRQRDQLAAANRELESFSYSVSHDLRAPLRSISGFSAAIEDDFGDSLPPEVLRYFERIRAASGRMGLLIDDLLKLSRLTRYEMRRETVSLSELAADIAANLQEQEPGRPVTWSIQPGLVVRGDGRLLRIALENLLGNAWKYTGTRERAEIFFGLDGAEQAQEQQEARGKTAYCVRDNGVGFDMAYAGKLFGAFQRLHSEREFPGTGIGLATVQRIVHRHGGRAWASAAVDGGAAFYFTLAQEG